MAGIHKATVHTYIQNGISRADKHFFCHLQSVAMEVFHRGHIKDSLKATLSLSTANAGTICNLLQIDFLVEMPVKKIQHSLHSFHAKRFCGSPVGQWLILP